ncbi:MAG: IS1595 family transposase [Actinobacteria bacterium]|nr:IS1595 family transposase [Actinomycetota bacterium]
MADEHPRAGVEYPRNWHELLAWFPDDRSCLRYLERLRWGAGFTCRFCGMVDGGWWQMADGLRRCAACRSETSVTAGTIFAGTRTPLVSWFAAVWYVVNQKQGVSALGLQRVLGLGSYQTAWVWLHKLRRAMVLPGRELLSGAVEVDESYIGARRPGSGGRGASGKAIVAIAVETSGQAPGRVRMRRIGDVTKDTLTDFVLDRVVRGSEVRTDGWQGYFDIGRHRFSHVVTNVSASGDPAHVVLPQVHLVASLVKRWILGTHQGAVSHAQLDYYLDEFTFRFNRRHSRHRGLLFYRLLEGAVATEPHPYKALTHESTA